MSSVTVAYFFYSAGILLREGLEALLVVVALAAAVKQLENRTALKGVYVGAIAALVASLGLACALSGLLTDNASDGLEGVFQLVAALTLLYVSSWMNLRGRAGAWKAYLTAQVERAGRANMPALALGLTSFTAVMREGAETIVFFQALVAGADPGNERRAIAGGIILASAGLVLLAVILQRAASRLPIRRFFKISSVLLCTLAVVFIGQGIASLQEAGLVHATRVNYVPTVKILGLFPTVESLSGQGILLVLALAILFLQRIRFVPAAAAPKPYRQV